MNGAYHLSLEQVMTAIRTIFSFTAKCTFICIVIMFTSMIAGELFIRSDLFNNFTTTPVLWGWISLETAISIIPVTLLGSIIINSFKSVDKNKFLIFSLVTWIFLYLLVAIFYKIAIVPNSSDLSILKPEIVWGWLIPGLLTMLFQIWLSKKSFSLSTKNT